MSHLRFSKGIFFNVLRFDPAEWEEGARFAKSLKGLQHLELWLEYLPDDKELSVLRGLLKGYAVIMHAPFIHQTLMSQAREINEASIDIFHRALVIAEKIGATVVTFHGGTYPTHVGETAGSTLLIENFSRVISSKRSRVTATLENLPQRGGTSTTYPTLLSHLATLRTHVANMKFTVDVGHCLQNDDPYDSFFRRYKNDVADIHLHDGVNRGSAHLAFGSGQFDVERFIRLLQDTDYGGFATLEMLSTEDTARSWEVLLKVEETVSRRAATYALS